MSVEIYRPRPRPDDDPEHDEVIDAEIVAEPSKTQAAKKRLQDKVAAWPERAGSAWAEQRANASARTRVWFHADDVNDAQLAAKVTERKMRKEQQKGERLARNLGELRGRRISAEVRNAPASEVEQLRAQEVSAQVRLEEFTPQQVMPPTPREIANARTMTRLQRAGIVVAAAWGSLQMLAASPQILLLLLAGGIAGWWALSRPLGDDEKGTPEPAGVTPPFPVGAGGTHLPDAPAAAAYSNGPGAAAAPPRVDLTKHPGTGTMAAAAMAAAAPETPRAEGNPGEGSEAPSAGDPPAGPESPTAAAAMDPLQIQGANDLITALINARVIDASEREETHLVGLIRVDGPGWTATVELPAGRTAADAVARLPQIASALRVKAGQIEIVVDTSEDGHEGRFTLWVANEANPFAGGKTPSELAAAQVWDFWANGVPLGTDARKVRQALNLVWSSLMIGGLQDYGKSYLARLIAAAAALDPYVRIILITGKPGPDWAPLKQVAHAYISGSSSERLREVFEVMDDTIADMQGRGTKLEQLAEEHPELCPEGKLTPELARQPGMELTLLIVDELQELLDAAAMMRVKVGGDEEGEGGRGRSGKDVLVETFARYVRVTRYVGGMGVFITQRPDADSVPTKLREVCVKRSCARVKGETSAKMVLGDQAVKAGAAPHALLEVHKGVHVLDQGAESGHITFKSDVIEIPEFREIAGRGRRLRIAADTLTGYAAEHVQAEIAAARAAALLADARAVFDALGVPDTQGLTAEALAEAVAGAHPGRYPDLDAAALRDRLREVGVTTGKIVSFHGGARVNGYKRSQLARPDGAEAA